MISFQKREWASLSTEAGISTFKPDGGIPEYYVMLRITDTKYDAEEQFRRMETAIRSLQEQFQEATVVWKRYFVSDAVNQSVFINTADTGTAVSVVQQPPLDGTKVAVWLYLVSKVQVSKVDQGVIMEHSVYRHLFHTQLHSLEENVACQTKAVFDNYIRLLRGLGCTLEKNCQRTWVFVHDVDTQYAEMVVTRRKCFKNQGLTKDTHFIASTGIEGKYIHPGALVFMDAYSIQGIRPSQIQYLYAPTHLNPTHQYGVTFERGTAIQYGDRRHIFISGTASINNCGEIAHPSNLIKQTDRMFENIRTLLAEAGADMSDTMHLIVYLRDTADYEVIASYMKQHYPQIPHVIVWAPVCRTGWLVEAECMAIKEISEKQFANF